MNRGSVKKASAGMPKVRSVLQINTRDQRGGAEGIAWNLFQAYQTRGRASWLAVGKKYSNDVHVWEMTHACHTSYRWGRAWLRLSEALSPLRTRYKLKGIGALQEYLHLLAQPDAARQRRQGYEDFAYPGTKHLLDRLPVKPDIIHCHNLHGNYFDLNALPWLSQQRPVLLHLHDAWLLSGHCAHSLDCVRWQTGCGNCPYLDTYPAIARDNTAANWQRKQAIYASSHLYLVAVSQWLMDKVQRSMLASVRARVIHNGIDLTIFQPGDQQAARLALGVSPTARIVLFSGHSAFKDLGTMQKALSQLQGQELIFIGLGQGEVAGQWGEGKLITPAYVQTKAQMADYYRAADLYLHAAIADSFPNAILESIACGTPVVATAVGGIPEQIQNGETGFLAPPESPQALANFMQMLLDHADARRQMGAAAATYAKQHFGLERQVDQFLAWYEEILVDWQMNYRAAST